MLKKQEENNINLKNKRVQIGDIIINTVTWFSFERAIGFALLFTACIYVIEPLREHTVIAQIAESMQIDTSLVGMWYTLGGLYLLFRNQVSAFALFACVFPIFLTTISHIVYIVSSNSNPTVDNISSEFIVTVLILQKIIRKSTVEFLEKTK